MALIGKGRKTGALSVRAQKAILSKHRDTFHQYLHVNEIGPYLCQHRLLSSDQFDEVSSGHYSRSKKVDMILKWVPKKGPDALVRLVLSLRGSASGTGTAHDDLANLLEQSLEISDSRSAISCTKLMWFSLLIVPILAIVIFKLQGMDSVHKPTIVNMWTEPLPSSHPFTSLPFPLEHFIGREKEMDDLIQFLDFGTSDIRGVSIVGLPGVGKSTLAIHTGQRMEKEGIVVHYVDLYRVHDIFSAKSKILSIVEFHALSEPVLKWARTVVTQTVLILDNCDDILHSNKDKFQELVKDVLTSSNFIKTIMTTKQMTTFLGNFRIYPLSVLDTKSAVSLLHVFGHNIKQSQAHEIAKLVGRNPLALQVIGSLLHQPNPPSSKAIIAELQKEPITFLSPKELPETQRVQTSIHISYMCLSPKCQTYSRLLANFPGSFTMEAVRSILEHWHATDFVDTLQKRSLLVYYQHTSRFQFHRLIREYLLYEQKSPPAQFPVRNELDLKIFWSSFWSYYWDMIVDIAFSADVYTLTEKWKIVDAERQNLDVLLGSGNEEKPLFALLKTLTVESKPMREIYSSIQNLSGLFANKTKILTDTILLRKTNLCLMANIKFQYLFLVGKNSPGYAKMRHILFEQYSSVAKMVKTTLYIFKREHHNPLFEVVNGSTPQMLMIDLFHHPLAHDIGHEEYVKMYTDLLLLAHMIIRTKTRTGAPEVLESRRGRILDLYSQDAISTSTKIKLYTKFHFALATAYILDNKHLQFMECWRAIMQVKHPLESCQQQACSHSSLGLAYYGEGDYRECVHHLEIAWQSAEGSTRKRARYLVVLYHAYREIGAEKKTLLVVGDLYQIVLQMIFGFAGVNAKNYRTCIILSSFLQHLNTQQSVKFAKHLWHSAMRHINLHVCSQQDILAEATLKLFDSYANRFEEKSEFSHLFKSVDV